MFGIGLYIILIAVALILYVSVFDKWHIFKRISTVGELPAKDPNDLSLTKSSTEWTTEWRCPFCLNIKSHSQYMADICNGCGSDLKWKYVHHISWRKIYDGVKWVYQFRYEDNFRFISDTFNHIVPEHIVKKHRDN